MPPSRTLLLFPALVAGCSFVDRAVALEGDAARGEALYDEVGCSGCHDTLVMDDDNNPVLESRGDNIRVSCRLDEGIALVDRVPEISDRAIARIVSEGRCLMPVVLDEEEQDVADVIAFLRVTYP